ncbi:Csr/MutH/archaeal HJR family nuclease [Marseillevirus marseillevirus]|uniref:Csr/MutH/archaeal HJR family nuclease n=1 Tax=Marseillevirus marseillevirus TaxID=694581 RepID=D2XB09_GBMV|nr:homing endonuclease [Marseillevirus marseillevirus]ADB04136.1 Csr/MutH/archaeal HJR family nuclease [Marseillevirus marseillevirus]
MVKIYYKQERKRAFLLENMTRKKTQEEVAQFFASKGHILIGGYEGKDKKVEYRCKCGKEGCYVTAHNARRPEWAGCAECAKKQQQETCLKKYGAKNPFGNKEIQEKAKKTIIEKYGTEFVSRNAEVKKKTAETNIKKYGAACSLANKKVREKAKRTCLEKYGADSAIKIPEFRKRIGETNEKRYGAKNVFASQEIKEKIKKNLKEKYGVEHNMQRPKVYQKARDTCKERLGTDFPMQNSDVKEKSKATCNRKFGVDYPMQNEEVKGKTVASNLERFGERNAMQNSEILEKQQRAAFRYKTYTFPSGRQMDYQGYEHFAIDLLLKRGIPEENIHNPLKKGIRIPYTFKEKNRLYNPDIFVDSLNLLVEVKSSWTYKGKKEYKELCLFKLSACREQGYKTLLLVFSESGEILKEKSLDKLLFSE